MQERPRRPVLRREVKCITYIFLKAVNWNCTSATFDWQDNNFRLTLIPSDDGWVMPLHRGKIYPGDTVTRAEDARQVSKSVYAGMAQWALQIFTYHMYPGYDFDPEEAANRQLSLF